jgi:hypothetical protein
MAFAEPFLGTDPTAYFRQVAGRAREFGGLEEVPFGGQRQPFRDAVMKGAAFDASGFGALDATARLFASGGFVETRGDLEEIGHAILRGSFDGFGPENLEPGVFIVGLIVHRFMP